MYEPVAKGVRHMKKILIVEDNTDASALVVSRLTASGFEVSVAEDD